MAILSKSRHGGGPSHGHEFDRIEDKLYGPCRWQVNKCKEVFTSDYVYVHTPSNEDLPDVERGVNKMRHLIHDETDCNDQKDEPHEVRYVEEFLENVDDMEIEDLMDVLNDDMEAGDE